MKERKNNVKEMVMSRRTVQIVRDFMNTGLTILNGLRIFVYYEIEILKWNLKGSFTYHKIQLIG